MVISIRTRLARIAAGIGVAAGTSVVTVAVIGLPVYVFPPQAEPDSVDVVFVIGPAEPWRMAIAEDLLQRGVAGALLVSAPESDSGIVECETPQPVTTVCRTPSPFTTQGEARFLAEQMDEHGWSTAIVVTTTPHVARAQVIMNRCVPEGVSVIGRSVGLDLGDWVRQYLYQTGAFVKAALNPGC